MNEATASKLSIFLSHKTEDSGIATAISKELETYAAGRIEFYLSEKIPVGEDWVDWIQDNLSEANWFMLLFTNPATSWDWCLYEAGMFRAGMAEQSRLFCLHHESVDVPTQLSKFQGVKAVPEKVQEFLRQLFGEPPAEGIPPINPQLLDHSDAMNQLADKICKAVSSKGPGVKTRTYYYNKYLNIHLEGPNSAPNGASLQNATIDSESDFEDIFGITILPKTWGEMLELIQEENENSGNSNMIWVDQIYRSIESANKGVRFKQGLSLIEGVSDKRIYRPILHSMRRPKDDKLSRWDFQLLFVLEEQRSSSFSE